VTGPVCRSDIGFCGAGAQCQRPEGHDGSHLATVKAQYSAVDTWYPGRGDTPLTLSWDAPVEGHPVRRSDFHREEAP
jgi:hypothetical protein